MGPTIEEIERGWAGSLDMRQTGVVLIWLWYHHHHFPTEKGGERGRERERAREKMPEERGGGKADVRSVSKFTVVVPETEQWTVGRYLLDAESVRVDQLGGGGVCKLFQPWNPHRTKESGGLGHHSGWKTGDSQGGL